MREGSGELWDKETGRRHTAKSLLARRDVTGPLESQTVMAGEWIGLLTNELEARRGALLILGLAHDHVLFRKWLLDVYRVLICSSPWLQFNRSMTEKLHQMLKEEVGSDDT